MRNRYLGGDREKILQLIDRSIVRTGHRVDRLEDALSTVELADTWDYQLAREWWSLHGLVPSGGVAFGVRP